MDLEKKKENKNKLQRSVLNKRKQKNYKTYVYIMINRNEIPNTKETTTHNTSKHQNFHKKKQTAYLVQGISERTTLVVRQTEKEGNAESWDHNYNTTFRNNSKMYNSNSESINGFRKVNFKLEHFQNESSNSN